MFRCLGTVKYGLLHGRRVSPTSRAGRKATLALAVSLVFAMGFLAAVGTPVGAQGDGNETAGDGATPGTTSPPRTFTVRAIDDGCEGTPPCWDVETLIIRPGDQVRILADFTPSAQPHNLALGEPINTKVPADRAAVTGGVHELTFTAPDTPSQEITFVCTVHPTAMKGKLVTADRVGGEEAEEVHHLGVHFLAYWVGLIAFAILFVVYGITFFLFKYNETSATTDHWDRAGSEAPSKGRRVVANVLLLALLIGAVAAAAMIILSLRGDVSDLNGTISGQNVQIKGLTDQVAALTKQVADLKDQLAAARTG